MQLIRYCAGRYCSLLTVWQQDLEIQVDYLSAVIQTVWL